MQPDLTSTTPPEKKMPLLLLTLVLLGGFSSTFVGGYFVRDIISPTARPSFPTPTPANIPSVTPARVPEPVFEEGALYLEDTLMAIMPGTPPRALVVTAARTEKEERFYQSTRMSWYNGDRWQRKVKSRWVNSSGIFPDSLIEDWHVDYDKSRVLKQSAQGRLRFGDDLLGFSTGVLQNEIGMRSLPSYTKFMSTSLGDLSVNGIKTKAHFIYTRIYSMNQNELQFYSGDLGIQTDWIGFFDQKGQFYHADSTTVQRPNDIYDSHQIGVFKDHMGGIYKTFQLSIDPSSEMPPENYQVRLSQPINRTLELKKVESFNKAAGSSWYLGLYTGTVSGADGMPVEGIGLVEYIED